MMSRLELAEIARRMSWPMRVAVASAALFVVALIALSVRGASDWSYAFAGFWYALALPAVLLGVIGLLLGVFARGIRPRERLAVLALSLPAPAGAALLAYAISQLADMMD
jgi:hypothetical protein